MVFESSSRNVIVIALVSLVASTALLTIDAVDYAASVKAAAEKNPAFRRSLETFEAMHAPDSDVAGPRSLQGASFDYFDPDEDRCDNSANPTEDRPLLEECNFDRFPVCERNEDICYNRKPSRDHFHRDNHQHKFYIQYDRVFCYPLSWGGCSSCTPGRYCKSEKRCILEEVGYNCTQWF